MLHALEKICQDFIFTVLFRTDSMEPLSHFTVHALENGIFGFYVSFILNKIGTHSIDLGKLVDSIFQVATQLC